MVLAAATTTQPIWLIVLGGVITLVLVPVFNMIKPYILTAEQRLNKAIRDREKALSMESEEMARLIQERDTAIAKYESEFQQRMELMGEHKFMTRMLAEMEVRHQECEASNRALAARMSNLERLIPPGQLPIVDASK